MDTISLIVNSKTSWASLVPGRVPWVGTQGRYLYPGQVWSVNQVKTFNLLPRCLHIDKSTSLCAPPRHCGGSSGIVAPLMHPLNHFKTWFNTWPKNRGHLLVLKLFTACVRTCKPLDIFILWQPNFWSDSYCHPSSLTCSCSLWWFFALIFKQFHSKICFWQFFSKIDEVHTNWTLTYEP